MFPPQVKGNDAVAILFAARHLELVGVTTRQQHNREQDPQCLGILELAGLDMPLAVGCADHWRNGDGSQSLLPPTPFFMERGGRERRGRTINTRFDLDKNYRNTREILKVATEFVSTNGEQNDPESGLQIVRPNPDIALRSGPAPDMLTASTDEGEFQGAVKKILACRERGLKPSEIAVLYRANTEGWVKRLASLISQQTVVYWPHDPRGSFADPSGVCVRTMHSAKGL